MRDRVVDNSSQRITCAYGKYSDGTPHNGVDIGWVSNEERNRVYANCKGTVVYIKDGLNRMSLATKSYGNHVLIKHPNGMYSRYCHLRKGTIKVTVGQEVDETTFLGIIGDSGAVKARHLHYEVQTGESQSTRINPTPYLAKPIWEEKKEEPAIVKKQKFEEGDKVIVNGKLYLTANSTKSNGEASNKVTTITRYAEGTKHPYNTTGDLGWMDEKDITLYKESTSYEVNTPRGLWLLDKYGNKVKVYSNGTRVTYIEKGYFKYGYDYYKVKVNKDGQIGYMAKEFLKSA